VKIIFLGNQADTLVRFRKELILELAKSGHEVILSTPKPSDEMIRNIKSLGCNYVPMKMNRTGINPFHDILTIIDIFKNLKQNKPDLLFSFTIKPVIYGGVAARLLGMRNCYSMITGAGWVFTGNSIMQKLTRTLVRILYRFSLGYYRTVFFLNSDDREMFINQNCLADKEKAFLIPGEGVNLTEFPYTPISHDSLTFLFVGRLLRDKGAMEFANAAKILKKRYPNAKFEMLGPLDSNPARLDPNLLQELIKDKTLEYLGETIEVQPFLVRCSVFVLPSYREGAPRATMEAMAMGRPIVTTDAPGCRDTVVEGKNGFLVPVKNTDALVNAMERFLLDSSLATRMGVESRKIAEDRYDVKKINKKIFEQLGLDYRG